MNRRHPWWAWTGLYAGVIALTWPQWAALADATGFGVVQALPGITDHAAINATVTLPVGVTAYQVLAVTVLVARHGGRGVAHLAAWSAGALGLFGAVAPVLVRHGCGASVAVALSTVVSVLPVVLLGAAVLLLHHKEVPR